jgi:hypothetical protein
MCLAPTKTLLKMTQAQCGRISAFRDRATPISSSLVCTDLSVATRNEPGVDCPNRPFQMCPIGTANDSKYITDPPLRSDHSRRARIALQRAERKYLDFCWHYSRHRPIAGLHRRQSGTRYRHGGGAGKLHVADRHYGAIDTEGSVHHMGSQKFAFDVRLGAACACVGYSPPAARLARRGTTNWITSHRHCARERRGRLCQPRRQRVAGQAPARCRLSVRARTGKATFRSR